MTDLRKAAEMALEALSWIANVNAMDYEYQRKAREPIKALRQALAQPEPVQVRPHEFIAMASKQANMIGKPVVWAEYPTPHKIILDEGWEWGHEARAKEALAQPEQEPVAWMLPDYGDVLSASEADGTGIYNIPLYTAPQKYCPSENNAAYEKGFVEGMAKQMHSSVDRAVNAMAKPWVGLTDEEINDFDKKLRDNGDYCSLHFAWGISAKLKEKNNGSV